MTVAPARLAATVIVLRPGATSIPEVLLVRRSRSASFMADAFVFPGGRVDDADMAAAGADASAALRIAAARELREEAAVHVDAARLLPWSRWITPSAEPRRFDAHFFVAVVPAKTEARVDAAEVTERAWLSAADALQQQRARRLKLPPPTLRTMEELARYATCEAVLAAERSLRPIQPKLIDEGGVPVIVLPWDAGFSLVEGEGEIVPDDDVLAGGVSRYRLVDGFFVGAG